MTTLRAGQVGMDICLWNERALNEGTSERARDSHAAETDDALRRYETRGRRGAEEEEQDDSDEEAEEER